MPASCNSADFTKNFVAEEIQGAGVSTPSATATVPRAHQETSAQHTWPQFPHLQYRNDNTGITQRQFCEGHAAAIQMFTNHELGGKKSAADSCH